MSEQPIGDKTEQPTPRKLEEASSKGQFPRSAEVQTVFMILAGLIALTFFGRDSWRHLVNAFVLYLSNLHSVQVTRDLMQGFAAKMFSVMIQTITPIVALSVLAGLLAGGIQSRFSTASEALTPNWGRLNPGEGLKRIFSFKSAVPVSTAIVKLTVIIGFSYSVVKEVLTDPIFYSAVNPSRIGEFLGEASLKLILRVGITLIFIAAADYAYQYWRTNKDMMMTRQEVKDEQKSSEGNPQVKSQQRKRRTAWSKRKMLLEIPKADVVVTNPTHLAIALRYDKHTMRAPKIVAKGARWNAQQIREIARSHNIPIVENKPLAQMMYKYGRVGGEVPAQLFRAVAEILAWVYRVNRYRYYAEQNTAISER